MTSNVQPPRGMRDFPPTVKARREFTLNVIRSAFQKYGYQEVETPVMEDIDRLSSGDGGENEKMIFRVLRRGLDLSAIDPTTTLTDLGLRYDLTLPLARFYATNHAILPSVFRSIQIASVWRAERPQKGRFRQFTQCDIDIIGEAGPLAEIELITATLFALNELAITQCTVRLNDRRLLISILEACGFDSAAYGRVLIVVDKLDKVGVSGVEKELLDSGYGAEPIKKLTGFLQAYSEKRDESFDRIVEVLPDNVDPAVLAELRDIKDSVENVSGGTVSFDPTLVRGMGYYTGPIFEITHPSSTGSIAGGGRYDGMIGRFLGTDVAASGFSIGFERIVDLVEIPATASKDSLALVYDRAVRPGKLVEMQSVLVSRGYSVRLVPKPKKLGKTLESLAADGYAEFAMVDADTGAVDDLAIRTLK